MELHQCHSNSELPAQDIRKAIDDLNLKARAEEEIELLKEEMSSTIEFYKAEHITLVEHIEACSIQLRMSESLYTKGCINLLKHRLLLCELMLQKAEQAFSSHLANPVVLPQFYVCTSSDSPSNILSILNPLVKDENELSVHADHQDPYQSDDDSELFGEEELDNESDTSDDSSIQPCDPSSSYTSMPVESKDRSDASYEDSSVQPCPQPYYPLSTCISSPISCSLNSTSEVRFLSAECAEGESHEIRDEGSSEGIFAASIL